MSRFRPGQLTAGDAAALNDLAARVDALSRMTVAPPLSITRNAGIPLIQTSTFETVLAEITGNDGGSPPVYRAKRKTRQGLDPTTINAVIDFVPQMVFEQVLDPYAGPDVPSDAPVWDVGTLVQLVPIPDWRGWFWGYKDTSVSDDGGVTYDCGLTYTPPELPGGKGSVSVDVCGLVGDRSITSLVRVGEPGESDDTECDGSGSGGSGSGPDCPGVGVDLEVETIETKILEENSWIELAEGKIKHTSVRVEYVRYFNAAGLEIDSVFGDPYEEYTYVALCDTAACCAADPLSVEVVDVYGGSGSGGSGSGGGCDYAWSATVSGGVPPYTYAWQIDGEIVGTETMFEHTFDPGTYTVSLTVTDSCGQRWDEWETTVECEDLQGCGEPAGCDTLTVAAHSIGDNDIPEDTLTRQCWVNPDTGNSTWWWVGTHHTVVRCGGGSLCLTYPPLPAPTAHPGTGCAWNSAPDSFLTLSDGECITFTFTRVGGAPCGNVEVCCGPPSPPVVTACCPGGTPTTLTATVTGTGDCNCLDGTYPLTWNGADGWEYAVPGVLCGFSGLLLKVSCDGADWRFTVGTLSATATTSACDPFSLTFSGLSEPTYCTGTFSVAVSA